MVAVITSTLIPGKAHHGRSYYEGPERIAQTEQTICSLKLHGFQYIVLIDNSPGLDTQRISAFFPCHADIAIYHTPQYQFANKGINELLMLLYITDHLPQQTPLFKVSGRYKATPQFKKADFDEFAVKGYAFDTNRGTISTRAYFVKNAGLFQSFLLACLKEVFAYPERKKGLKGLVKLLLELLGLRKPKPMAVSIEFAAANVLKANGYRVKLLQQLHLEGMVAGSGHTEQISE